MTFLTLKSLFEKTIFKINHPHEIDLEKLSFTLNTYSFAVIRGLIDPEHIVLAKSKLINLYASGSDHPATGENPSDIMTNFQKLSIGGAEHSGVYRPRCMRTFYNPIWADNIYGLRDTFVMAAKVRNIIYGFHQDFAVSSVQDGFWTASRIHSYPAGGGFLVSHVDDIVPVVQKASGISRYFQPVIIMSKKGNEVDCDFITGGGFFELDKRRYYYEEEAQLGDLVIYSGATVHGVEDIDLHVPFDTRNPRGRFAGFVTLYRHFTQKGELKNYINPTSI